MNYVILFWFDTETIQTLQRLALTHPLLICHPHICLSLSVSLSGVQYRIDPVSNRHSTLSVPLSVNCALNKSVSHSQSESSASAVRCTHRKWHQCLFLVVFLEAKHHFFYWLVICWSFVFFTNIKQVEQNIEVHVMLNMFFFFNSKWGTKSIFCVYCIDTWTPSTDIFMALISVCDYQYCA